MSNIWRWKNTSKFKKNLEIYNIRKNIWKKGKIKYHKLERVSDQKNIWRKTSSTVSWKIFQDRKKLIHREKIPYAVYREHR
jgi:hypothetical protein